MRLVVKYQQNPLRAARALAYAHVALHDAWWLAATDGQAELAAHRAASLVLEQLYPNETPGQFEAQFALLAIQAVGGSAADRAATDIGHAVAQALIARSLNDGAGRVWSVKTRPAAFHGIWQPTYPLFAANPVEGLAPQWLPWVTPGAQRYEPPTAFRPGSAEHRRETQEVAEVAKGLNPHQVEAAKAWNLAAGSVTPGGVWMQQTLDALAAESTVSPSFALQALAALSVALHDAFVACWRIKLRDWSERPVTAIRRDLNPTFKPLLVTPGFPSYVSGHATVSGAAAQVLGHFWPARRGHFEAQAQEAALSRLWGGIHFRSDNDEGLRLGQSVGAEVVARL